MKAMILAAGLGTRLRPLTEVRPKALMPVVNKPVIAWTIAYLKTHGVSRIVVNAHHHYRQLVDFLDEGKPFGLDIEVRVEPVILGTGGGIKNTSDFWNDEPFIVINGDILTNIPLDRAYDYHKRSGGLVTLVLHDSRPFNQILVDRHHSVIDIARKPSPGRLAFTGIHIMEPELLSYIPEEGFSDIITCYRGLLDRGETINGFRSEGHDWRDIGSLDSYRAANRAFLNNRQVALEPGCRIDPGVRFSEWCIAGENCRIEEDVEIRRSILWDNVRIRAGRRIVDSIVTSFKDVNRDLIGEIY